MAERFRLQHKFWLDGNKPEELALAETIAGLKDERAFSQAVRDGIRLIAALREGDISVLNEIFPWVIEDAYNAGAQAAADANGDGIQERIDELARLIKSLHQAPPPAPPQGTLKPMPALTVSSDLIGEDFELEIKKAGKDEDNNSTWNFIISSALNVYGNCDGMAEEIVQYGLRTGRIKPEMVGQGSKKNIRQKNIGGPKAMDVPQFSVPIFDDSELPDLVVVG